MPTTLVIDPVTRLEGHLKVEVTVDTVNGKQQVVAANSVGTMFRGFENILQGRNPLDSPDITMRICGVCPVSHATVACKALEDVANVTIPSSARILRNLVLGANFVQSHILHFYHLAIQDYVNGPNMAPWQPGYSTDKRFTAAEETNLVNHYLTALDMRRQAHEMGALFGGKLPHPASFVAGGMTRAAQSANVTKFKTYLSTLASFIQNTYMPDVDTLESRYSDYLQLGGGYGNMLAYGVFDLDSTGNNLLLRRGYRNAGGSVQTLDTTKITESVTSSWYSSGNNLNPASGATTAQYPKTGAYSWLKAPRYSGNIYEVGPLARMVVNGDYVARGAAHASVMDRHQARSHEALKVATAMSTWIGQVSTSGSSRATFTVPSSGTGIGLAEAPRGALGHWVSVSNSLLSHYQIITPTCWNASPKDSSSKPGALERALVGTPVVNMAEPVEILRVIHSFDPCMSCAVHVMRPKEGIRIFALGMAAGA